MTRGEIRARMAGTIAALPSNDRTSLMSEHSRLAHWQSVYTSKDEKEVSWFQDSPTTSLDLIELTRVDRKAAIIDIGGGASRLVDALVDRGFESITVLDLSAAALDTAKARLGHRGAGIQWIADDATTWQPDRIYELWHDRAAFHFLTSSSDIAAYLERMNAATATGSHIIFGTFAPDGPEKCSGLIVNRYDAARLAEILGDRFQLIDARRHDHTTPWGATQRFQFSTFLRMG